MCGMAGDCQGYEAIGIAFDRDDTHGNAFGGLQHGRSGGVMLHNSDPNYQDRWWFAIGSGDDHWPGANGNWGENFVEIWVRQGEVDQGGPLRHSHKCQNAEVEQLVHSLEEEAETTRLMGQIGKSCPVCGQFIQKNEVCQPPYLPSHSLTFLSPCRDASGCSAEPLRTVDSRMRCEISVVVSLLIGTHSRSPMIPAAGTTLTARSNAGGLSLRDS